MYKKEYRVINDFNKNFFLTYHSKHAALEYIEKMNEKFKDSRKFDLVELETKELEKNEEVIEIFKANPYQFKIIKLGNEYKVYYCTIDTHDFHNSLGETYIDINHCKQAIHNFVKTPTNMRGVLYEWIQ